MDLRGGLSYVTFEWPHPREKRLHLVAWVPVTMWLVSKCLYIISNPCQHLRSWPAWFLTTSLDVTGLFWATAGQHVARFKVTVDKLFVPWTLESVEREGKKVEIIEYCLWIGVKIMKLEWGAWAMNQPCQFGLELGHVGTVIFKLWKDTCFADKVEIREQIWGEIWDMHWPTLVSVVVSIRVIFHLPVLGNPFIIVGLNPSISCCLWRISVLFHVSYFHLSIPINFRFKFKRSKKSEVISCKEWFN